jgi:hypothetical protein
MKSDESLNSQEKLEVELDYLKDDVEDILQKKDIFLTAFELNRN